MTPNSTLTDDLIREMLVQRASRPSAAGLLGDVMRAVQARPRRARGPLSLPRPVGWPGLAGVVAVAVVALLVAMSFRPAVNGPGETGPSARPSPTAMPASPTVPPSAAAPTPQTVAFGSVSTRRLQLGFGVGPIDVVGAFDSIWTADIHANDVRRFDPATMALIDSIPVPGGPAWFAVVDGALWVSTQNGKGVTRIDPGSNTIVTAIGDAPPCAAPVVDPDTGSLWQAACDGNVFLRIDPTTNTVVDALPAAGHTFLVLAGGRLITTGPSGLARLDPASGKITPIGAGGPADLIFSDGDTVWGLYGPQVRRVDPADGRVLATFPYAAHAVAFGPNRAWLTVPGAGVVEIDQTTNRVLRTIPVPGDQLIPRESDGVLWLTDFDASLLWRVEP